MGKNNQRPGNTWDEDDEIDETSGSFDDDYADETRSPSADSRTRKTPYARESDTPTRRPRGGTGGGRIYEEGDERPTRPRPTRQSREEVYSRYRQRPRQPVYSRQQPDAYGSRPPTASSGRSQTSQSSQPPLARRSSAQTNAGYQASAPRGTGRDSYVQPPARRGRYDDEYDDYGGYDDYEEQATIYSDEDSYEQPRPHDRSAQAERRRRLAELPDPELPRKRRRGRGIFSTILIGCLGGIITLAVVIGLMTFLILHNTSLGTTLNIGKSPYHLATSQTLSLGNATQLIVQNQVGNISVQGNANATGATLESVKTVEASSQSDADQQFKQITLTVSSVTHTINPTCLATSSPCLLISVMLPGGQHTGPLGSSSSDTVDLTITLPATFTQLSQTGTPATIAASTTSGTISVDKFNGILDLSGSNGTVNIAVTNSLIFAGTCLQTTNGNVTIGQQSLFDLNSADAPTYVPCSNTQIQSGQPWYVVKTDVGNLHISLNAKVGTSQFDLKLEAYDNQGKITNTFGLPVTTNSDGSLQCIGSLNPDTTPVALLYVDASTGNIQVDKG